MPPYLSWNNFYQTSPFLSRENPKAGRWQDHCLHSFAEKVGPPHVRRIAESGRRMGQGFGSWGQGQGVRGGARAPTSGFVLSAESGFSLIQSSFSSVIFFPPQHSPGGGNWGPEEATEAKGGESPSLPAPS